MADTTQQQTGLMASSDYVIKGLYLLTSTGQAINLIGVMLELNLYESIFNACMTGDLLVGDGGDMISSLQLHGNEFLTVRIDKPSLNQTLQKVFRIYKISNRSIGPNALQNYTFHFCSEELFLSTQYLISKSYKGLTITKMVQDILLNKLNVDPKKIAMVSQSVGNFDLIVPKMQPLQAIEWLAPKAYTPNGNLFFFYENRDGYNFASYEDLLKLPVYATYSRAMKVDNDPAKNIRGYNSFQIVEDFDVIKATRMGAYSASLISFDVVNRSRALTNLTWAQPNKVLLNKELPINDLKNRFGQKLTDAGEAMLKYVVSSDSDPTGNPAQMENWVPQTISRLGQLNTFKAVMIIPGDIVLKSGMVVRVNIPKMEIQSKAAPAQDPQRSGQFLVSKVHHNFKLDISTTIVELLTDSVSSAMQKASSATGVGQMVQG